jgi:hypothetical protein
MRYRAPELLFGSFGFGPAIDVWGLGLVFLDMCDFTFLQMLRSEDDQADALFDVFGLPAAPTFDELPGFLEAKARWSTRGAGPGRDIDVTSIVQAVAGGSGFQFCQQALAWSPRERISAKALLDQDFLQPERFQPVSNGPLAGCRHEWAVLDGGMSHELVKWLRADPAFVDLKVTFDGKGDDWKTEASRKWIKAGSLSSCASGSMCALKLKNPIPLPRIVAWFSAFRAKNADAFASMHKSAVAACRKLSESDLGVNGHAFLDTPLDEWLLTCGELCISNAGSKDNGFWEEERHQDGGGSILHMGLTVFGCRTVVCERPEQEHIDLRCFPGKVYMGNLTGPWHQVKHTRARPADLWEGEFSVTVMCRCALFAANRARQRNTTPNPPEFFRQLAASFTKSLVTIEFKLPSLKEVLCFMPEETPPRATATTGSELGRMSRIRTLKTNTVCFGHSGADILKGKSVIPDLSWSSNRYLGFIGHCD